MGGGGFWRAFDVLEESVMAAGLGFMVLLNFLNVLCRYLLPQTPFSYTEELELLLFIWVSMFGISYGYRRGTHTAWTIIMEVLPRRLVPAVAVFAAGASALLMCLLVKTGVGMVLNQMRFGQIMPGMRLPMAVVGCALPVGGVLAAVSVAKSAWNELAALASAPAKEARAQ
ncbi:MAG: TRAP transporter small permease [Synergistaceae bacterium]|jgi:TRAP-type C4-dicarboxylate transport system permease small subunit|nr:TRAP transporter small permease [Synergistaceae bacterium]